MTSPFCPRCGAAARVASYGDEEVDLVAGCKCPVQTRDEALLADVVARIASCVETQARSWRAHGHEVVLPEGFAQDVARNAAGGLIDLLLPDD